jgi:hypothetical protein
MNHQRFLSAVGAVFCLVTFCAEAIGYSGGTGTVSDPFQISTVDDWKELTNDSADWDKCFILTIDIDLGGIVYDKAPIAPYIIIDYYGARANPFTGKFNGNNHRVKNLKIINQINESAYFGLFGYIDHAQISNLRLEDVWIQLKRSYDVGTLAGVAVSSIIHNCSSSGTFPYGYISSVGGLIGHTESSTITSCHAEVVIKGETAVGGLIGYSVSDIINSCSAMANIEVGGQNTGGLVGQGLSSAITACFANSTIVSGDNVGGLIGLNDQGIIDACSASGNVRGHQFIGGLAGSNGDPWTLGGTITSCFSSTSVLGMEHTGGLVGYNNSGQIFSCYASGSASGDTDCTGGLTGTNYEGEISFCYSTGLVSGLNSVGGLIGRDSDGVILSCFWDIQSSGRGGSAFGKGLNTAQMKTLAIFQNAGWVDRGWVMEDGKDYPRLAWENTVSPAIPEAEPIPLIGSGTEVDPYQIHTAEDFALLSWYSSILNSHIALKADLDLNGIDLDPIGDLGIFGGVFEGNSHQLMNVIIPHLFGDCAGLFSQTGTGSQIRNLRLVDAEIVGRNDVGGIVGRNQEGTILSCEVTGNILGTGNSVGGLVGRTQKWNGIEPSIRQNNRLFHRGHSEWLSKCRRIGREDGGLGYLRLCHFFLLFHRHYQRGPGDRGPHRNQQPRED